MNRLLLLLFPEMIYSEVKAEFFETSIFKYSAYPACLEMQYCSCCKELHLGFSICSNSISEELPQSQRQIAGIIQKAFAI